MKNLILAVSLVGFASLPVVAFAQTATPAATDKQAISKSCSDQANAKNLHGKERKKFRSECKRSAMKGSK